MVIAASDSCCDSGEHFSPMLLFARWFAQAKAAEMNEPEAAALATVGRDGMPRVRMMLVKGIDERGFVFFTNLESRKGRDIAFSNKVTLLFHWKSLRRQVIVGGKADVVSDDEANVYFATRPRGSQIGAWASAQSRPLKSLSELKVAVSRYTEKFGDAPVPRPQYWSGFRVVPFFIEFWSHAHDRLHTRVAFTRNASSSPWVSEYLNP